LTVSSAAALSPVSPSEFDEWISAIGYFEPNPAIVVATSGGADSMALLLLARDWVADRNGKLISLTVDHCLRPESAQEAQQVGNWCQKLSIEHHILRWEHASHPLSSIQDSARKARYNLILEYCRQNHILHLLTAHHLNDQAETLFFRLARSSNLEGLSSMSAQTIISGIRLMRPFLQTPKTRLIATLKARGQGWIEDPSNQNQAYTRVRIRKQLAENPNELSIINAAGHITNKLGYFRKLLENKLASQVTNCIELYDLGFAVIKLDEFSRLSSSTALKTLSILAQTISGLPYPPRSEKLERLHYDIGNGELRSKRSFSGLLFEKIDSRKIIIYREPNAVENPALITPDNITLWDRRFLLEYSASNNAKAPAYVRALGSGGLAQVKEYSPALLRGQPPARILRNIPSIWILEELISVPHIKYMNKKDMFSDIKFRAQFYPVKPLAGSGFFVMNNPTNFKENT
jgi:tRNA(Ile)-lysidine synthase